MKFLFIFLFSTFLNTCYVLKAVLDYGNIVMNMHTLKKMTVRPKIFLKISSTYSMF